MITVVWYVAYLVCVGIVLALYRRGGLLAVPRAGRVVEYFLLADCALVITRITDTPWWGDFLSAYYPAGRMIFSDPLALYGNDCAAGFVNLPIVAVLFVPFAELSFETANLVFLLIGLVAIVATIGVLARSSSRGLVVFPLVCALFALNGPLWYGVREGNTTHIVLLMVVLALVSMQAGRGLIAGVLLGLAAVVKLPLALFGVYLLVRGRWRATFGFGAAIAVVVALSVLVHGVELHSAWLHQCVLPYAGMPVPGFNAQSVAGVLARGYGGNAYDWQPMVVGGSFIVVQRVISATLLLAMAFALYRGGRPRDNAALSLEFGILIVFILLVSPLTWTHYYLLLLLPLTLLATGDIPLPTGRRARLYTGLALGSGLVVSLPLLGLHTQHPVLQPIWDRVLSSAHFFGAVVLFGLLLALRDRDRDRDRDPP